MWPSPPCRCPEMPGSQLPQALALAESELILTLGPDQWGHLTGTASGSGRPHASETSQRVSFFFFSV